MLRDSKLRFDRLSPTARLLAVGAVLLCGLLVAGLRGPDAGAGFAEDAGPASATADAPPAGEPLPAATIDLAGVPADANAICVLRPAAIFRRPELDEFGKMLNEPGGPGDQFHPAGGANRAAYLPPAATRGC